MACKMCINAHTDPDLTSDNDLSYFDVGKYEKSFRLMLRTGDGRPTGMLVEHLDEEIGWNTVGFYWPKFCPNCGRKLTENEEGPRP